MPMPAIRATNTAAALQVVTAREIRDITEVPVTDSHRR